MRLSHPPLRLTLGVKLAIVVFAIVVGALAIVYLMVVPRLESRLVDARVNQLEVAMPDIARGAASGPVAYREAVDDADTNLNARVVIFRRLDEDSLIPIDDSRESEGSVTGDPVVERAAASFLTQSGRVERGGREYAEAALAVGPDHVVLLATSLDDALANVRLVRRSVIVAGLVALLAAAAAAYVAAIGLTGRLRRLQSAADRIAAGDFSQPVAETRGADEVGELARAFDAMRVRLADLDRVRREFIANASHELRTPLFSLGGFLELLADEDLPPDTRRDFLAETRAQVERLTRLATDLLDLSRLDAGQLSVERGTADLTSAARSICEEFRAVAETTDHPLGVTAADEVLAAGDHERVIQIGRILVENALRHTPAGTAVEILAEATAGRAVLAVHDRGPGIPEEDQEHVFERFYRAGGGKASGSGLGLSIARELAMRMDGALVLASQPGDTRFTLALPLIPHGNARHARSAPPATAEPREQEVQHQA